MLISCSVEIFSFGSFPFLCVKSNNKDISKSEWLLKKERKGKGEKDKEKEKGKEKEKEREIEIGRERERKRNKKREGGRMRGRESEQCIHLSREQPVSPGSWKSPQTFRSFLFYCWALKVFEKLLHGSNLYFIWWISETQRVSLHI